MNRTRRHRLSLAGLLRFARQEPVAYDELADAGDLRERLVEVVDERLEQREAS